LTILNYSDINLVLHAVYFKGDAMDGEATIDLDRVVSAYIKLRDKKRDLTTDFEAAQAVIDSKLHRLERALLGYCDSSGAESVRTESGTFYRSVRSKYWTSDWESMNRFIIKHEVPELLEKRVHQGNMKQFLEDHPDLLPPGLNRDSEYTVTVRRKK